MKKLYEQRRDEMCAAIAKVHVSADQTERFREGCNWGRIDTINELIETAGDLQNTIADQAKKHAETYWNDDQPAMLRNAYSAGARSMIPILQEKHFKESIEISQILANKLLYINELQKEKKELLVALQIADELLSMVATPENYSNARKTVTDALIKARGGE